MMQGDAPTKKAKKSNTSDQTSSRLYRDTVTVSQHNGVKVVEAL